MDGQTFSPHNHNNSFMALYSQVNYAGLEIATNTVTNATNICSLATKTFVAVIKLLLDFTQTLFPYMSANATNFSPNVKPCYGYKKSYIISLTYLESMITLSPQKIPMLKDQKCKLQNTSLTNLLFVATFLLESMTKHPVII